MRPLALLLGCALTLALPAHAPAGGSANSTAPDQTGAVARTASTAGSHEHHPDAFVDPDSGEEMLGQPAPEWSFDRWIRTEPLLLESLRGKVVVLRWWTEGCRFCRATLPVLEQVQKREGDSDLVVIGVFHPKPPRMVSDRHVLKVAKQLGFSGPIAVDSDWSMLDRYWLDGHPERNWTSISFIIDRQGVIRWVHGGGEYHLSDDPKHAHCVVDYHGFEAALAKVLAEKPPSAEPAP